MCITRNSIARSKRQIHLCFTFEEPYRFVPTSVPGRHQTFNSSLSNNNNSNFVNAWSIGTLVPGILWKAISAGIGGTNMNYQQWSTVVRYRFGGYRK